MNTTIQQQATHAHIFNTTDIRNERRIVYVIILTAVTMFLEIITGFLTGSMALLANGWHMGTHFFALGITYFTYIMARHFADTKLFTFGTGKFGILSAYTSSLLLGASAIFMIYESIIRFINPVDISYNEAIIVTIIGLVVNLASVILLRGTGVAHNHGYEDKHAGHEDKHEANVGNKGHDQNLKAAYMHIIADILTSVLAIIALLFGKFLAWSFLDPLMGILGGLLIMRWVQILLMNSGLILLDYTQDKTIYEEVRQVIESDSFSKVSDLHIWPLNEKFFAATVIVISKKEYTPTEYRERLVTIKKIKHIVVEIHYDRSDANFETMPDKI